MDLVAGYSGEAKALNERRQLSETPVCKFCSDSKIANVVE
jgi:hypothetical protein